MEHWELIQNGAITFENSLAASNKVTYLPTQLSNLASRYLLKISETYVHTKTCPQMLIETSLIVTQNWKPPKCPSSGE